MSTWKSKKVPISVDCDINYAKCDAHWEYQTTSDTFSYIQTLSEDFHDYSKTTKSGEVLNDFMMGHETAVNLYHALANWMKQYNSEKDMMKAIDDNVFEYKEEE
jgi:hypothetical protein